MKEIFDFSKDWKNERKPLSDSYWHTLFYRLFHRWSVYSASGYYPDEQILYKSKPTGVWIEWGGIHYQFEMEHGYLLLHSTGGWDDDYFCFLYLTRTWWPGRTFTIKDAGTFCFFLGGEEDDTKLIRGGLDVDITNYNWRDVEIASDKSIEFSIVPRGSYRLTVNEKPNILWSLFHMFLWLRPWGAVLFGGFRGSHIRIRRLGPWRPEGWKTGKVEPPPKTPPVEFSEANGTCIAKLSFPMVDDDDEHQFACEFHYPDDKGVNEQAGEIETENGDTDSTIEAIKINGVEFLFSAPRHEASPRIERIRFQASSKYMEEMSFNPVPSTMARENFALITDWYGVKVKYHHDNTKYYDRARNTFAVRFKTGSRTTQLHRLADTVAIGIDDKSHLTEIRFDDISDIVPPFGGPTVNAEEWFAEQKRWLESRRRKAD